MPPHTFQILRTRSQIIQTVREYFITHGFLEVDTPNLVSSLIPESYLEYFKTKLIDRKGTSRAMYLTTSPESSLKKLLAGGIGNCFEITKSFRNNETDSATHNPEFTILEWYRINSTYEDIMKDCEDLFLFLLKKLKLPKMLNYQSHKVDLTPPWERLSLVKAFKKYAHMDLERCLTDERMRTQAVKKSYLVSPQTTWEEIFNQIILNEIEPHLGTHDSPTILFDYPSSEAALAQKKPEDPRFAERFELYIAGLELGDCYTELIDPKEQEKRFEKEQILRKQKGKMEVPADTDFLEALKAVPLCSGIAVGLDRLVMLFTDSPRIQDVLAFPYQNS